jgi:hypothetical protein
VKTYIVQFDGQWETIKILKHYSPTYLEIVMTIIPVAGIRCDEKFIEKLKKEPGIITIEEDCKGYLCFKESNGFTMKCNSCGTECIINNSETLDELFCNANITMDKDSYFGEKEIECTVCGQKIEYK